MGGISATTATDLLLAAGAYVEIGEVDMGALEGTIHYWVEMETYFPDLYGAKGNLKGTGHDLKAVPKISFSMKEFEYAKFQQIWNRLGASSDAASEKVGDGTIGKIADSDYKAVTVLGSELHSGKDVKIVIDNAYLSNNPDFTLSDREDATIEVELTGAYLVTAPTTFPARMLIEI